MHEVTAARLSAHILNAIKDRNGIEGHAVEDVIWGNATQVMEQGGCFARTAVLASDLDERIPGLSRSTGSVPQAWKPSIWRQIRSKVVQATATSQAVSR